MTDKESEVDTTDYVFLRKEGKRSCSTSSSSNSCSSSSLIYVTMEEVPSTSEYESVIEKKIMESIPVNSVFSTWYLKFKREVLRTIRNKVYPIILPAG
ncbi:hypothetical protein M0802_008764 [Mischocyttarus mexicanus]|nr:hypothetical protein M0802_008764 [Mischocyttarus mexicanus]